MLCCSAALSTSLFSFSSFMAAIELITLYAWVVTPSHPPYSCAGGGGDAKKELFEITLYSGVFQMEVIVEVLLLELC